MATPSWQSWMPPHLLLKRRGEWQPLHDNSTPSFLHHLLLKCRGMDTSSISSLRQGDGHMARELLAGVTFFQAVDSGHTATLLAAISEVLAARHFAPRPRARDRQLSPL